MGPGRRSLAEGVLVGQNGEGGGDGVLRPEETAKERPVGPGFADVDGGTGLLEGDVRKRMMMVMMMVLRRGRMRREIRARVWVQGPRLTEIVMGFLGCRMMVMLVNGRRHVGATTTEVGEEDKAVVCHVRGGPSRGPYVVCSSCSNL